MLNRRKAMIGWLVYSTAKPLAKYAVTSQAKKVASKSSAKTRSGTKRVLARGAALVALAGGVLYWRRRRDDGDAGDDGIDT